MSERREVLRSRPLLWLVFGLLVISIGWWSWPRGEASEVEAAPDIDVEVERESIARTRERPRLEPPAKAAIAGFVRTRGGAAIAGAEVCATPMANQLRGADDPRPRCTRSEADGHYRLASLWPVRVQVSASARGHRPRTWRSGPSGRRRGYVSLEAGGELTGIDFELDEGGARLAGVVEDLGGGPIEGAMIRVGGSGIGVEGEGALSVARSDAEGRFELWVDPGPTTLFAFADGYALASEGVLAPSERVELYLTPESVLVGRVVDASTGDPLADVAVSASAVDDDATRSDGEGRFQIGGLSPGVYQPVAVAEDGYGEATTQIHLGLGQTSEPIEIRVHPMARIAGEVVVAESGEACRAGWVALVDERIWGPIDDRGRVVLRGVALGEYEVEVYCQGYRASDDLAKIVVAGPERIEQRWEVHEGQVIRGEVVDGEGRPVADASVDARPIRAGASTAIGWPSRTEADGSFELAGLQPGTYELHVRAEQPSPDAPTLVELAPGVDLDAVRIELLASGTIVGRVVDELGVLQPGVGVSASDGARAKTSSTDDHGEFRIEQVRTGSVLVAAEPGMRAPGTSDDDEQGQWIEVLADRSVEVELRVEARAGSIRGRVLDEGGTPVDDAFVHAQRMSDSAVARPEWGRAAVRVDADRRPILTEIDGSFTIPSLSEGAYVVRAYRKGGGEALAENVAIGSSIELTITPTGALAGVVELAGASPPERFSVDLRDVARGLYFHARFYRTEGEWRFDELPAGVYDVTVSANEGSGKLEGIELGIGASREDLALALEPHAKG
ncbi:carboxypeptidase regulatory-like domain-containing protein [Nannocystaceae bacterium ST9]